MRPRRPFRRNMLRRVPPLPPGGGVPPLLMEANQLFMAQNYVRAGERYAGLAAGAEQKLLPQAAQLYLQASRAFLLAHHPERAEQLAQQGLFLLASQSRWRQLARLGPRVIWEFEHQGHKEAASRLSAWLQETLPEHEAQTGAAEEEERGVKSDEKETSEKNLPRICPSCGAPVDPRDVDWADQNTPLCAFCAISLLPVQ